MNKHRIFIIVIIMLMLFSGCTKTVENQANDIETTPTIEVDEAEDKGYIEDGNDIHITKEETHLTDMTIEGDLYIDETVGDGNFYLENITVNGTIYVNGGGENSGHLIKVYGSRLIINSPTNPRLVCDIETKFEGVQIACDCKVEAAGNGINNVVINNSDTAEAVNVMLKGEYPEVSLESAANVTLDGGINLLSVLKRAELSSINMVDTSKVYFYSCYGKSVTVSGGTIVEAWINAEHCSLPEDVEKVSSEVGVADVKICDVTYSLPNADEYQTPQNDAQDDNQNNSQNDNQSDQNNDGQTDGSANNDEELSAFILPEYPRVSVNGMNICINIACYSVGKVHIIIDGCEYGMMGTTPEKVRDGISAGSSDPEYTVISKHYDIISPLSEHLFAINMDEELQEDSQDDSPEDDQNGSPNDGPEESFGLYIFIVVEDNLGNLSGVYQIIS